jgi:hypothetical protein
MFNKTISRTGDNMNIKVLIVEDNKDYRALIHLYLTIKEME